MRSLYSLGLALALCGCEKAEPLKLAPDSDLYGAWEYQFDEFGNGVATDQFLLVIHRDSTIDYKRCKNRLGGHNYTTLPNAVILEHAPDRIRIGADIFFMSFDQELLIEKGPHAENGETYMQINGARLRRLKHGETSNHETWKCSSDDG